MQRLIGAGAESTSSLGNTYARQKPNIALVPMDNPRLKRAGVYGRGIFRDMQTPRIDQMATEGTRSACLRTSGPNTLPAVRF
jgi:hypothetical protein